MTSPSSSYYEYPECPECEGRGYLIHGPEPVQQGERCHVCKGKGHIETPLPSEKNSESHERRLLLEARGYVSYLMHITSNPGVERDATSVRDRIDALLAQPEANARAVAYEQAIREAIGSILSEHSAKMLVERAADIEVTLPDAPQPATQRNEPVEHALDQLAEVHRHWCNYCCGDAVACLNAPVGGCALRDYMIALDAPLSETPTTQRSEQWDAADLADAKTKLSAIAQYVEGLENFDDATFLRTLAGVLLPSEKPATQRSEPVAWRVTRDSEVDGPEYFETAEAARKNACLGLPTTYITPLYAAPHPSTASLNTGPSSNEGLGQGEGAVAAPDKTASDKGQG